MEGFEGRTAQSLPKQGGFQPMSLNPNNLIALVIKVYRALSLLRYLLHY